MSIYASRINCCALSSDWMEFRGDNWCIFGRFSLRSAAARFPCFCAFLRHSGFLDSYSTVPVDVVRAKSYVDCLFHPARVKTGIAMINELYLVLERAESCFVGVL